MDYTVNGASLGNNESIKKNNSTNFNNYENYEKAGNTKTNGVSFTSVIRSGILGNINKMNNNTYESLLKETDDVKSQIMESASNAKANLKALFNKLSGAEAVSLEEEGFNLNEATPEDMINIVDRIKIELAAYSDKYIPMGNIDVSKIAKVVGSDALANEIAEKMTKAGLTLNDNNIEEMAEALKSIPREISEEVKDYMVAKKIRPSIENINIAEHAIKDSKCVANKIDYDEWRQLQPQILRVMRRAGLEDNGENMNNARTFVSKCIPVTERTLTYKSELDHIDMNMVNIADKIAKHMAAGEPAQTTFLTEDSTAVTQVKRAMEVINNSTDMDIETATYRSKTGEISLRSIEEVLDNYRGNYKVKVGLSDERYIIGDEKYSEKAQQNIRTMMEVRIMMSADAGIKLARQGLNINTIPISSLHKHLLAFDREITMEHISRQLSENLNSRAAYMSESLGLRDAENAAAKELLMKEFDAIYDQSMEVRKAVYDLAQAPIETAGAIYEETLKDEDMIINLENSARIGMSLRQRFKKAGQAYETYGTMRRSELGDSLDKAVKASATSLLAEIGCEATDENIRAVRILSYNNMDVTPNNLMQVKEINSTLQELVKNMNPEAILDMIRDNVNPMKDDIHDVNEYLKEKNEHSNNIDKYSTFLYKLDMTDGISAEERAQFIGLYKMTNMFRADAGMAIGTLLRQGNSMTMENLCRAYDINRSFGIDKSVNNDTEVDKTTGTRYYLNLFSEVSHRITPLTLKNVNAERKIDERSVENFCDATDRLYDAASEAEYMDKYMELVRAVSDTDYAVLRELENADQKINLNNIQAMEQLMQENFYEVALAGDRAHAQQIIDSIDDKEKLEKELKNLSDKAEEDADNALQSKGTDDTFEKIGHVRLMRNTMTLLNNMAMRRDYSIPYLKRDGIGVMKLTVAVDKSEKGKIAISYDDKELGQVILEAKIKNDTAELYGTVRATGTHGEVTRSDTERENKLSKKLSNVSKTLGKHGINRVQIYHSASRNNVRPNYDYNQDMVPTEKLYKIAKTIVLALV